MKRIFSIFILLFLPLCLWAKSLNLPTKMMGNTLYYVYIVENKDNIYSVSKKLKISKEDILKYNPKVADGIKKGDTLYFPVSDFSNGKNSQAPITSTFNHTVEKGETIYGISKRYKVPEDHIVKLNPHAKDGIKQGDILIIPQAVEAKPTTKVEAPTESYAQIEVEEQCEVVREEVVDIDSIASEIDKASLNVAIILPFMLNTAEVTKQAQLYTEYYKGFLLAVDSIKDEMSTPLNIYAYDSHDSVDSIKAILSKPEMLDVDIIVAPDDINQLKTIATFASENDIKVVNSFVVKDESYNHNAQMMQMNIPHTVMYQKVIDGVKEMFESHKFIFIGIAGDEANDKDLVKELSKWLNNDTTTIRVEHTLTTEILDQCISTEYNYVIVPTNSNRKTLSKINVALKRYKSEHPDSNIALLGYPEWITFQNDYKETFHSINTYIYSRFYADTESLDYTLFELNYKKWYGTPLLNVAPSFGLLGFDSAMFVLRNLNRYGENLPYSIAPYNGIQNDYSLTRVSDEGGYINNSVYFIHYDPSGIVLKIRQ